jgi:hypothetical protein
VSSLIMTCRTSNLAPTPHNHWKSTSLLWICSFWMLVARNISYIKPRYELLCHLLHIVVQNHRKFEKNLPMLEGLLSMDIISWWRCNKIRCINICTTCGLNKCNIYVLNVMIWSNGFLICFWIHLSSNKKGWNPIGLKFSTIFKSTKYVGQSDCFLNMKYNISCNCDS